MVLILREIIPGVLDHADLELAREVRAGVGRENFPVLNGAQELLKAGLPGLGCHSALDTVPSLIFCYYAE